MASELNTSIMDLYKLPYYEFYYYIKQVEEENSKKKEGKNVHDNKKIQGQRGDVQSIETRNSVNLPEDLKG